MVQTTGKGDEVFLAGKFGCSVECGQYKIDSSGEYCKRACDASLQRLGTNHIDLCVSPSSGPLHFSKY